MNPALAQTRSASFVVFALAIGTVAHGQDIDAKSAISHLRSIGVRFDSQGDDIVGVNFLPSSATDRDARFLVAIKSLQSIDFGCRKFTDASMQYLTRLPHLRSVNLSLCPITDRGLAVLAENQRIESLNLTATKVADLTPLTRLKRLKSVDLSWCSITDAALACLADLESLVSLNLGTTEVTDEGVLHLAKLKNLESLCLAGCRITDAGASKLAGCSRLKRLVLAYLTRGFDYGSCHVSSEALQELREKRPGLEIHGLPGKPISGKVGILIDGDLVVQRMTLDQLSRVSDKASVRTIDFSGSIVNDASLSSIGKFENLETLDIQDTWITDSTLKEVSKLRHLESLDLSETRVTDAGVAQIATCTALKSLDLESTMISGVAFRKLTTLTNLVDLNVSRDGGRWYGRLALSPGVSDDGLQAISKLSWVKRLSLDYFDDESDLSPKGIRHLFKLKNLRELGIFGLPIDDELLNQLREALPNTEVSPVKGSLGA